MGEPCVNKKCGAYEKDGDYNCGNVLIDDPTTCRVYLTTQKEPVAKSPAAMAGYAPFKPPFKYDVDGLCILDSADNMIVDMRGWGFLTGKGAMAYDSDKAAAIQDSIGRRIAQIMTEDAGA